MVVTQWQKDHIGGKLCQVFGCLERARWQRTLIIDDLCFLQFACDKHAEQENKYCDSCGCYIDRAEICPRCEHRKVGPDAAENQNL